MTWYSASGPIRVVDMGDRHLLNSMRIVQRRAQQARSDAIVSAVIAPYGKPEDFIEASIEDFAPRIYATMVREVYKRDLMIEMEEEPISPGEQMIADFWNLEDSWELEDESL